MTTGRLGQRAAPPNAAYAGQLVHFPDPVRASRHPRGVRVDEQGYPIGMVSKTDLIRAVQHCGVTRARQPWKQVRPWARWQVVGRRSGLPRLAQHEPAVA